MKNKILAFLLAMTVILSLSACTSKAAVGAAPKDHKITIRVMLPNTSNPESTDTHPFVLWLEEQTGYEVVLQKYKGRTDPQAYLTELFEKGEQPDLILGVQLSDAEISHFGHNGQFLDLKKYYDDSYGASKVFWDRLAECCTAEEKADLLSSLEDSETGAMYSVPTLFMSVTVPMDYQTWINSQWLQELELDAPATLEELYAVLKTFKANYPDCVPLYGCISRDRIPGADLVNWLINNYLYFNDCKPFTANENGRLHPAFITDEYRNALRFIHKLIDEDLLVMTDDQHDLEALITPADSQPKCGIFVGHPVLHTDRDAKLIFEPLAPLTGQTCTYNTPMYAPNSYICADSKHPDEAFTLMMTLWTEDASIRMRYGTYGADWTEAEAEGTTIMGTPAKIQTMYDEINGPDGLSDFLSPTLYCDDHGLVQYDATTDDLYNQRYQLTFAMRKLYDAAALENNPAQVCPVLRYTEESLELRTAIDAYFKTATDQFIQGERDPNSDADWNQYLSDLANLGLKEYTQLAQAAYDRL